MPLKDTFGIHIQFTILELALPIQHLDFCYKYSLAYLIPSIKEKTGLCRIQFHVRQPGTQVILDPGRNSIVSKGVGRREGVRWEDKVRLGPTFNLRTGTPPRRIRLQARRCRGKNPFVLTHVLALYRENPGSCWNGQLGYRLPGIHGISLRLKFAVKVDFHMIVACSMESYSIESFW